VHCIHRQAPMVSHTIQTSRYIPLHTRLDVYLKHHSTCGKSAQKHEKRCQFKHPASETEFLSLLMIYDLYEYIFVRTYSCIHTHTHTYTHTHTHVHTNEVVTMMHLVSCTLNSFRSWRGDHCSNSTPGSCCSAVCVNLCVCLHDQDVKFNNTYAHCK